MTAEPDPIDDAWAGLQAWWDDADAHRKCIALCATHERRPEAGRRYREVREKDPDPARRGVAEAQIDRLLSHAMLSLQALRTEPPRNLRPILFWIATALTLGMIGIVTWLVLGP